MDFNFYIQQWQLLDFNFYIQQKKYENLEVYNCFLSQLLPLKHTEVNLEIVSLPTNCLR